MPLWGAILYGVGIWSLVAWGVVLIVRGYRDRRDQ